MTRHATVACLIGARFLTAHATATPIEVPALFVISAVSVDLTAQRPASPREVPAQLVISEVSVDLTSQLITISGEHFGAAPATVTLSGLPLTLVSQTATRIVALLPAFAAAAPGTFLLTVTREDQGPPPRRYDDIDVTIGAAGSRGEQGPQGEPGPVGPPGRQGEPGPQGPKGEQGVSGGPGLRWTGQWSASVGYTKDDAVEHEGTSYIAAADAFGVKPPSSPWQLLAVRGLQGQKGEMGLQGPAGSQGPLGEQGPIGPTGPQGAQGPQGSIGAMGPTGPIGPMGPIGPFGPTGDRGEVGPPGLRWKGIWRSGVEYLEDDAVEHEGTSYIATAATSDVMPPSAPWESIAARGAQGDVGPQGPIGPQGPQGEQGPLGPVGLQGLQGLEGPLGPMGPIGPIGPIGPQGSKGDRGEVGPPGLRWRGSWNPGTQYLKDDAVEQTGTSYVSTADNRDVMPPAAPWQALAARGLQGEKGEIGLQGPAGLQGPRGEQGPIGPMGPQGAQGPQGPIGPTGPTGLTGPIGQIGPMGPQGSKGDQGEVGPPGLRWKGTWASGVQYLKEDAVEHEGTSYIATAATLEVMPPSAPWQIIAARGTQGDVGSQGLIGPQGPQGEQGPIGPVGAQGLQGLQGPLGPMGPIGPIGPIGPQGPKGDRGEVGPPGLRWRGPWNPGTQYLKDDAVEQTGTSYVSTADNRDVMPPAAPWQALAARGLQGAMGPMGPQGPAGPVDNLGNHTATQTLNMNGQAIANASNVFASSFGDRDHSAFLVDPNGASNLNVATANEMHANGWFRVNGSGGIFWQQYGGGWNMTDGKWLRTFGNKPILATGGVAGAGNAAFGSQYGGASPRIFANFDNASGGGLAISDDGGFYDFNDGWVQFRGRNGLLIRTTDSERALTIDVNGIDGGTFDKAIAPTANGWGKVGTSGRSWWEMWSNNFYTPSDERVKKDIEDISRDDLRAMLDRLDKVRTVRFRYLDETATFDPQKPGKYRPMPRVGVIAQSLPEELVAGSEDEVMGIDIAQTLGYALATIKALRGELRELKQEVDNLRGRDQRRD